MNRLQWMEKELEALAVEGNRRSLPTVINDGQTICVEGQQLVNLSSNDYLGLASDKALRAEFLSTLTPETFLPSASSSRLLTGNFPVYEQLERLLAERFGAESALVFNSGYHANVGILPAVCHSQTVVLADKLVHASLIDGLRLTSAKTIRYRHQDLEQLARLVAQHQLTADRLIIVTESLFSMDGDETDLRALVELKKRYPNVWLYVDEAHAVGVRGVNGLGCAEEQGCLGEIDFLVGTFGKALASVGAYVVCRQVVRDYLVNKMRPLIFTTALPPVNVAWSAFLFERLPLFTERRMNLQRTSTLLREGLRSAQYSLPSTSHIIPLVCGESQRAVERAEQLQRHGFYALPVRPPTVPEGSSRLRFSLTAQVTPAEITRLIQILSLPLIS
ncbi:MAG: 8-amino-7-oxononanoate synthase [Bacteroidia bacterium]|nr:8-amino-7-oxononanoate synthase [Bacteroidia bacterium]